MRPARALAPLLALLVAAGVAGAGAGAGPIAAKTRTTSVGIGEREFKIAVYKRRILPGYVRFNVTNYGEDAHDLRVIGPTGTTAVRGSSPEIKAGRSDTLTVRLVRRGVYTLVCTLSDHESRGMVARLRVLKRH